MQEQICGWSFFCHSTAGRCTGSCWVVADCMTCARCAGLSRQRHATDCDCIPGVLEVFASAARRTVLSGTAANSPRFVFVRSEFRGPLAGDMASSC